MNIQKLIKKTKLSILEKNSSELKRIAQRKNLNIHVVKINFLEQLLNNIPEKVALLNTKGMK